MSTPSTPPAPPETAAEQLAAWRTLMLARPAMNADDVAELESHLLDQAADLRAVGLTEDEAFLIAMRRLGGQDAVAREYAQIHTERLWHRLAVARSTADGEAQDGWAARGPWLAILLGLAAGLAVRLPAELHLPDLDVFYALNISFLVLPFLAAYLAIRSRAWHSPAGRGGLIALAVTGVISVVVVNVLPLDDQSQSLLLTTVHLPVALLLLTGAAYLGGRWLRVEAWMDWLRFLGESVIYYVLIAMAGGALVALLGAAFLTVWDYSVLDTALNWVIPVCAAGAVLVVAWLVTLKRSAIENMAPVLTAVLTPFLTLALLGFLLVVVISGGPRNVERGTLIGFDLLLVVVAAIVLFTVSARAPEAHAGLLERMHLAMILAALAVDLIMLWAMSERLLVWGATPNKVSALGLNLLLLLHLAGSAWHYVGVIHRSRTSLALERWQCLAVPVFSAWCLVVALVLPLVLRYQ
ncbi:MULTISPECIES: permease prefix domain 1-containing protein [Actinomyces]|uniref:DUF4153 domain-containing protein n=1 Tax=Actinomyces respiraculi TaxID=2744574 RepID=A0A7T0LKM8_9ACTO|nr:MULTISPECIES: permease prefix domain 1-containing protein [Actinomyces]QPL05186.1 hypothetical protein ID810_10745 [Actinomyces respiraculi]